MISIGKSGARSAGPSGWPVPGWSGGAGGLGRSGTMLYQWVGRSRSSSTILICLSSRAMPSLLAFAAHRRGREYSERDGRARIEIYSKRDEEDPPRPLIIQHALQ